MAKREVGTMRLKDDWDPNQSAFQDDDGKFDGRSAGHSSDELVDATQLRREQKIQALGKQIVSTLYMLIRNVKIHQPDNAIFLKPIDTLREAMNRVIATERSLNLQAADTNVYLNNARVKFDFSALETVTFLTKEFERRDIGGFSTNRPVTSQEIRDFLWVFSGEYQVKEDGVDGHQLPSMKLARYAQVKELLDKLQAEPDLNEQIDRKKYLMTVYARSVFFMRMYFQRIAKGDYSTPRGWCRTSWTCATIRRRTFWA